MHWYSTLRSILFQDRHSSRNREARRHRLSIPRLASVPQPALTGGALDRRAIRLRRD